ncbi:MAG TPA: S24 family peptidase [Thermoanaerobaculia bacterium]|jgi:SOS-response transcriptional repressor LexA
MDLAARLRTAIDALGQTQSWVAARSEVPEETISRIVTRETKNPQVGTLMKLAPVLGVTVGWLLGEKTAPLSDAESRAIAAALEIIRTRLGGGSIDARRAPNAVPLARAGGARTANASWPELSDVAEDEIPREYATRGAKWIFRADGDSMTGCGIIAGDRLYVREIHDLRQAIGDVVICRLAGATFSKRLIIAGSRVQLASANERYEPIAVDEKHDAFDVFGIVVGRAGAV